jgi:hypothetical protein
VDGASLLEWCIGEDDVFDDLGGDEDATVRPPELEDVDDEDDEGEDFADRDAGECAD